MDERKKDMKGNVCTCGCCGYGYGMGTRMLFRMLLAVIILILVFWFGVKLGELRESIRGYNGFGSRGYYSPMQMTTGASVPPAMPIAPTTVTQ